MIKLNPENFDKEILKAKLPAAVLFCNDFSGPCLEFLPIVEAASKKYSGKMKFATLDIEKYPKLGTNYIDVESEVPSIIFFKKGEEVERILGSYSEYALNAKIGGVLMIKK